MALEQQGIFQEGSRHHYFLEYRLQTGIKAQALRTALKKALQPVNEKAGVHQVIAMGMDCWELLCPDWRPASLNSFATIRGNAPVTAPATQQDLLLWLHSQGRDLNFDQARACHRELSEVAQPSLDLQGFVYHDSRDLTGFVDGTENPKGEEARQEALVADGQPGAGGSHVLTQRWIHDLEAFEQLDLAEQQRVIGRTRPDSIELPAAERPASHVSRSDLKIEGVAQKLYRRSVPYGSVQEHGLYFLAFACDPQRFTRILHNMFGNTEDGIHDRLTHYSRPVTGSYWFAPASADLDRILS